MRSRTTTIIEHRRRTDAEGWATLIVVLLTALAMITFGAFFFGRLFPQESYVVPAVLMVLALAIFSLGVYYAVINIRARDTFVCRMDSEVIECISPVKDCGDSFVVPLSDVARVEKEDFGDSHRWYIWNSAGQRFWLTSNYNNPADVFANALQNMNPHVKQSKV